MRVLRLASSGWGLRSLVLWRWEMLGGWWVFWGLLATVGVPLVAVGVILWLCERRWQKPVGSMGSCWLCRVPPSVDVAGDILRGSVMRRRRILVAATLLLFVWVITWIVCSIAWPVPEIRVGMAEHEVEVVLGKPGIRTHEEGHSGVGV